MRTFSQKDGRYTRKTTWRGGGTTALRTTSRGEGTVISRTISRGGQATILRRVTNVSHVNAENLYDSEAQDTEEEDFQMYRSRRMRKNNRALTGRKICTGRVRAPKDGHEHKADLNKCSRTFCKCSAYSLRFEYFRQKVLKSFHKKTFIYLFQCLVLQVI